MKKTALVSVAFLLLLSPHGYGQPDSAKSILNTNSLADSSKPAVPVQQNTERAPILISRPADVADKGKEPVADPKATSGYFVYWLIGCGLLGVILGAVGYHFLSSSNTSVNNKTSKRKRMSGDDQSVDDGGFVSQWNLEQEHAKLVELNKTLTEENIQLKRDKDELEQLLKNARSESETSAANAVKDIVFYMPQPNMNGRFQEASKRTEAADALYAFHVTRSNPENATFEFIAKDAYLNAAIGNEPSWISIACERTNQPSGTTTRVKTEIPGLASLKDGEWEITRKAKITYL